jgi:tetratricopeptide (TPR) repeat protein
MNTTLVDFDKLWDYDKPDITEEKFKEILNNTDINDDGYKAELLTQIARTQALQLKFDEAHKTLNDALTHIKAEDAKAHVRYLLERGRVFNSSKQQGKAKPLFWEAYKFALKNNMDYYAIDAAHMMGIVEKAEDSLKWNEIAISIAEASTDERSKKWLGSLYNNTAWTFHDMGQYDKALELFERNVIWHEERNSKKPLIIAKWSVARTFRSLNKIEEALKMQLKLVDQIIEMGLDQDGYVFEEIGECLLLLGKKEESKGYFKSAYELLSKDIWLAENEKERIERMKKLSE